MPVGGGREVARELRLERIGVALDLPAEVGIEAARRAQGVRLDTGELVLHLAAEHGQIVVGEDVEPGHHIHQLPDVLDQAVAEHQGLAVLVLAQAFADTLDRLAQAPVEIALGIVEAGPDLLLDVPLDPLGLALGQIGHEVARVGDRDDAVANGELALKRLRAGIVLQAEQPAEVEAGLVDVIVVVLDEAGALAHHALDQCVQRGGVALVVGDGEQAAALVVPGQGVGIVTGPGIAHGRGQRGEGLLGQEAFVVAPGTGVGVVMDSDLLARLAVVEPAGPGVDPQADEHGVMGEVHGMGLLMRCQRVLAAAHWMKAWVCWSAGSRRMQEPTRNSPTSRRSRVA